MPYFSTINPMMLISLSKCLFLFSARTDKNTLKLVVVLFCNIRVLIYLNALRITNKKILDPELKFVPTCPGLT